MKDYYRILKTLLHLNRTTEGKGSGNLLLPHCSSLQYSIFLVLYSAVLKSLNFPPDL